MIMDAKELRIGDWVSHKGTYVKIEDVTTNSSRYKYPLGVVYSDGRVFAHIAVLNVDPIPITEEMLEKNGFEFFDSSYFNDIVSITFLPSCIYFICHVYKGEVCDVIERHIDYVHELQHLLRLCGLKEMADSFVV